MPVIRISDSVFKRLQAIATPFVDTPASVIAKLLDFYESPYEPPVEPTQVNTMKLDPDNPPDLRHTRVLAAHFNGQNASNWNNLVYLAHSQGMVRLQSFEELRSATKSNIVSGQYIDHGFHYFSDINVSIQNVDANSAWRNALHLARYLKVEARVEFEWREKEGAAYPGKKGVLSWKPGLV